MKSSRFFLLFWALTMSSRLLAQEQADTIVVGNGLSAQDIEELTRPISPLEGSEANADAVPPTPSMRGLEAADPKRDIPLDPVLTSRYQAPSLFRIPPERPFYPSWGTGMMYGYSSQHNDWLRGYQARAGVGLYQQLGDYWSFTANASLYKNSIYYNSAMIDGSLTWRPNAHFGVTVFGSYSPGTFLSPVDFGQSFNWGGYMTLEGERFGVDLGAQTYYDPWMGHSVEPIVKPYVKFGDAKIGIDIGPMLKDALQKDRRNGPGFSPIPQPIKAVPQVAPRR